MKRVILFFYVLLLALSLLFGYKFIFLFVTSLSAGLWALRWLKIRKADSARIRWLYRFLSLAILVGTLLFVRIQAMLLPATFIEETDVPVDYMVILGARLKGDILSLSLERRLQKGLQHLKTNTLPVVVTGGQGPGENQPEALAMGSFLRKHGIAVERIYQESKATTTKENLLFSKQLMQKKFPGVPKVLIVTSDYHMHRAKWIGKSLGMQCYGLPSHAPILVRIDYLIRESMAVVKAWLTV